MGSGYVCMYVCSSHCPPNELHAITSMHGCTPLGTLYTDKGPPTYHLQGQEGNQCDLAHGMRMSSVSRKTYSWPALYGTHNPQSEIMAVHTHFITNVSQMHYDRVYNC